MRRNLRPVLYQLLVGGKIFSQTIPVYAYPRKDAIITLFEGKTFLVIEEHQELDMYLQQRYKEDHPAEAVTAIPFVTGLDVQLLQLLRADKKWIESEAPFPAYRPAKTGKLSRMEYMILAALIAIIGVSAFRNYHNNSMAWFMVGLIAFTAFEIILREKYIKKRK
jgi:hypothetical protein